MQHRFKVGEVNASIMKQLETNHATAYFSAMSFQLGCAIGELIAMGLTPEQVALSCDQLITRAVEVRLSVDTKEETKEG